MILIPTKYIGYFVIKNILCLKEVGDFKANKYCNHWMPEWLGKFSLLQIQPLMSFYSVAEIVALHVNSCLVIYWKVLYDLMFIYQLRSITDHNNVQIHLYLCPFLQDAAFATSFWFCFHRNRALPCLCEYTFNLEGELISLLEDIDLATIIQIL